jgi:hypothetical protein
MLYHIISWKDGNNSTALIKLDAAQNITKLTQLAIQITLLRSAFQ